MLLYGALKSKIDIRDNVLKVSSVESIPEEFELSNLPDVKNQRKVNSCVAHATSSILEYFDSQDGSSRKLSTNFIYGIQHELFQRESQGMYLRDACSIVKKYGDPEESLCQGNTEVPKSWDIAKTAFDNQETMNNANYFKIDSYFRCNNNDAIKKCILQYGPVLACIPWYDTFKVDKSNILSGEQEGEYGYHAIMIYGWNKDGFLFQNSWGKLWGHNGRAILPYSIKITEARGLIDSELDIDKSDIVTPKRNCWLDIIYKIINSILNAIVKR